MKPVSCQIMSMTPTQLSFQRNQLASLLLILDPLVSVMLFTKSLQNQQHRDLNHISMITFILHNKLSFKGEGSAITLLQLKKLPTWNSPSFMIKIDLAKAFDRLEWNFIVSALARKGLQSHFINLIYACISTASFSVIINGQSYAKFRNSRGIRQGCLFRHTFLYWS